MTSKTSFFNKGIFKSTIKRFAWGSVMYFVILFISTILSIISTEHYFPSNVPDYFLENPLILSSSYLTFPLLLAIAVPSVTSLLVFRFLHSKKQIVFTHALPVSRKANYISTVLGGFTLMAMPIILNAVLLMITSVCGYGKYFDIASCFVWLLFNLLAVFMMYAPAVFSAVITGNSFAMIVINILFHCFFVGSAAALGFIAEVFVYGLPSANALTDAFASTNFVTIIMNLPYDHKATGFWYGMEMIAVPIVIYVFSYCLYKKRKSETASDVAGFSSLQKIFKYMITFFASVLTFAFFDRNAGDNIVFYIVLIIVSAICYFGSEMLIKKTTKVFGSYKGYILFGVVFAALLAFFAFTSFFGYETKVPKANEIESVSAYNYYKTEEEPFSKNEEVIKKIVETHKEIINDIPLTNPDTESILHIKYKLKNGKEIHRRYHTNTQKLLDVMNEVYKKDIDYKLYCEFGSLLDAQIVRMELDGEVLENGKEELFEALKKDVAELDYEQLNDHYWAYDDKVDSDGPSKTRYGLLIEYIKDGELTEDGYKAAKSSYFDITNDYIHTLEQIKLLS